MDMKEGNLLRIISLLLVFTSCEKTVCPEFSRDMAQWLPYNEGDTIELINEQNMIVLPLSKIYKSDRYSFDNNCDCDCESHMSINTIIDTIKLMSINASINLKKADLTVPAPIDLEIVIYGKSNGIMIPLKTDVFSCNSYSSWNYKDSAYINNQLLRNVLTITNNDNTIYKSLTIIKSIGIFEIIDKDSIVWAIELK